MSVSIKRASDLRVYQISIELLDHLYEIAYLIPHLNLRMQLIKSGEAIAPLISEGFSRQRNPQDAARYYELAMVESDEVSVHLEKTIVLSKRFKRISRDKCLKLIYSYQELSKQLNRLRTTWKEYAIKKRK